MDAVLATHDFSRAKGALSEVMTEVVHGHRPQVISRHRGKERMLLVRPDDLVGCLETFRFEPLVVLDGGEVTVELAELGVLGLGSTLDEAMADLVAELRLYARRFFEQAGFYLQSDRRGHAPWLLRFALTPEDEQLALLLEDSQQTSAA